MNKIIFFCLLGAICIIATSALPLSDDGSKISNEMMQSSHAVSKRAAKEEPYGLLTQPTEPPTKKPKKAKSVKKNKKGSKSGSPGETVTVMKCPMASGDSSSSGKSKKKSKSDCVNVEMPMNVAADAFELVKSKNKDSVSRM